MTSSGVSCTPSARRRPNTRISGMRALASRPVFAGRSSASIVIDAMLCTRCCLVFVERGAVGFAANRPFGSVPFAAGIACEASNPSVSAVTEPHAAIVIVGLLSLVQRLVRTTVPFGTRARPAGLIPAHGAPDRIRTDDTRFRRAVLYPLSYQGKQPAIIHSATACGQRCGFRRAANHSRGGWRRSGGRGYRGWHAAGGPWRASRPYAVDVSSHNRPQGGIIWHRVGTLFWLPWGPCSHSSHCSAARPVCCPKICRRCPMCRM